MIDCDRIGIIGGQGPIASASFTETIYEIYLTNNIKNKKPLPPIVYLISEPLNKKSDSILTTELCYKLLLPALNINLDKLYKLEPDHIIICCLAAHSLLDKIPAHIRHKIKSLLEIIIDKVISVSENFVLLSAPVTRELKILESHPLWKQVEKKIYFINHDEQVLINMIISDIKSCVINEKTFEMFFRVINNYPDKKFILACSELHVIHKKIPSKNNLIKGKLLDPFYVAAENILFSKK